MREDEEHARKEKEEGTRECWEARQDLSFQSMKHASWREDVWRVREKTQHNELSEHHTAICRVSGALALRCRAKNVKTITVSMVSIREDRLEIQRSSEIIKQQDDCNEKVHLILLNKNGERASHHCPAARSFTQQASKQANEENVVKTNVISPGSLHLCLHLLLKWIGDFLSPIKRSNQHYLRPTTYYEAKIPCFICQLERIIRIWCVCVCVCVCMCMCMCMYVWVGGWGKKKNKNKTKTKTKTKQKQNKNKTNKSME